MTITSHRHYDQTEPLPHRGGPARKLLRDLTYQSRRLKTIN